MRISQAVARRLGVCPIEVAAPTASRRRVRPGVSAVVVGGGVAGVSAAVILAERGVQVRLLEAEQVLGGRLGAVPYALSDGTSQWVDHGFHAFFRQYYNWRAILRRVDSQKTLLRPVERYPVISREWPSEDFGRLPAGPPLNLLALLLRSPSVRLRDLRRMDRQLATAMLAFDPQRTYRDTDGRTAQDFLDRLGLPDRAIAMLFEVFAHSFFNVATDFSAAELLANFHFYFLGNPEGLSFDAPRTDYQTGIWAPLTKYLEEYGAVVTTAERATRITPVASGWLVQTGSGEVVSCRNLVLALDPPGLRHLVANSELGAQAPVLAAQVAQFASGPPYAVARYWFDGDVDPRRPTFCGVSRSATLDSVTLYHRLDPVAGRWARENGGSVVELHAYANTAAVDATDAADRMRTELAALWPETAALRAVDVRARMEANAPAFAPGSHRNRPGVRTDAPGLVLAGDGIGTDLPSALLERAATTGISAANAILADLDACAEPLWTVPPRGLLA